MVAERGLNKNTRLSGLAFTRAPAAVRRLDRESLTYGSNLGLLGRWMLRTLIAL